MVKFTFTTLTFLLLYSTHAYDFSQDTKWLNLHRYLKDGPQFKSLVTNKDWFFSPAGKFSPQEEASAAIKEFQVNAQARCRFPARVRYLTEIGFLKPIPTKCPGFDYIMKKLRLEKVFLIFASYHINNPSSAFGHTFFKLQGTDQSNDYLNWGLNFSAIQTTNNPLIYGFYGLSGLFKAKFSLLPYFIKLKEYQDYENRDLWEYQLKLSKSELQYFVEHLWEMNTAQFDYYYLTKNCSFHLLAFLDAINPRWELIAKLPYFVIPSETLKTIANEESLAGPINFRPSPFKKLKSIFNSLKPKERPIVKELSQKRVINDDQLGGLSTEALDFLMDYMDSNPQEGIPFKRALQVQRSKRSAKTTIKEIKSPGPPHEIHPSSYLMIGRKENQFNQHLTRLEARASFDEYLDDKMTRESWSQLVLGKLSATYNQRESDLRLEKFTLLNIEANNQSIFSSMGSTWSLDFSISDRELTKDYDLGPYFRTSYGINFSFRKALLRFFIPVSIQYAKKSKISMIRRRLSLDTRLTGQILYQVTDHSALILTSSLWYSNLLESKIHTTAKLDYRWHFTSQWAFDIDSLYQLRQWQYGVNLVRYF